MWDRIIEKLSQTVSRRSLLGRAASACWAVPAAICGFAVRPALALNCGTLVPCWCCCVCSTTRCGGNYEVCDGTWCWTCHQKGPRPYECWIVDCIECYVAGCTTFNNIDTCPSSPPPCGCHSPVDVYCSDCVETVPC